MPRTRPFHGPSALLVLSIAALAIWPSVAVAAPDRGEITAEAEGVLPVSPAVAREVLLDVAAFGNWFPSLASWRVLSRTDEGVRIHGRHDLPWPTRDRDYVVDYRWRTHDDGRFELVARARADGPAPAPRVVRLDVLESRWHLEAHEAGTRVRYAVRFLPRGDLPRWIEAGAWRRESWRLIDAFGREIERRARAGES